MFARRLGVSLFLTVLAVNGAWAATVPKTGWRAAGERGLERGVHRYRFRVEGATGRVDLVDVSGAVSGQLDVRLSGSSLFATYRATTQEKITIHWEPEAGRLVLEDAHGTSHSAVFDDQGKRWAVSPGFLKEHSATLDLLGAVLGETLPDLELLGAAGEAQTFGSPSADRDDDVPPDQRPSKGEGALRRACGIEAWNRDPCNLDIPPPDPIGGGGGVRCFGPWHHAYGYSPLKSQACANARQEVNYLCSNGSCFGCCDFSACNSWCLYGDGFWCVGVVEGRACSR